MASGVRKLKEMPSRLRCQMQHVNMMGDLALRVAVTGLSKDTQLAEIDSNPFRIGMSSPCKRRGTLRSMCF